MNFQWIVITFLVIASGVLVNVLHDDAITSEQASLDALSRGMLVYRSVAAEYAHNNPGFTGVPSTLSLPAWYNRPAGVSAYIENGQAFTYYSDMAPGLPAALSSLTESIAVGVNRAGILISPNGGTTGIAVPGTVPNGAVVAVN